MIISKRRTSVGYMIIVMKRLITLADVGNWHERNTSVGTIGWERRSIEKCARDWSLTIVTNGICTKQNLCYYIRTIIFLWCLEYKRTCKSQSEDKILLLNNQKRNCLIDFSIPVHNKMEIKRRQNTWNLQESWKSCEVTMSTWNIPQDIGKETSELEIRGRIKTIQVTALLKSARILRRVLETREDELSLKL